MAAATVQAQLAIGSGPTLANARPASNTTEMILNLALRRSRFRRRREINTAT